MKNDNGTGLIIEEWLRLRHRLIPYLYSAAYRTHRSGRALIEPLYYEWDTPCAYQYKNQNLFGDQLWVIPAGRRLRVLFKELDWDKTEITVYEDGKPMTLPLSLTDSAAVEFPFTAGCSYKIDARFTPKTKLDVLKDRTLDILLHSEHHPYYSKTNAWRELLKIEDLTEFVWTLEKSFSPVIVEKILESF